MSSRICGMGLRGHGLRRAGASATPLPAAIWHRCASRLVAGIRRPSEVSLLRAIGLATSLQPCRRRCPTVSPLLGRHGRGMAALACAPERIRNVAIIAHVDHGKVGVYTRVCVRAYALACLFFVPAFPLFLPSYAMPLVLLPPTHCLPLCWHVRRLPLWTGCCRHAPSNRSPM